MKTGARGQRASVFPGGIITVTNKEMAIIAVFVISASLVSTKNI